ncbi:protein translocase subunit secG [Malonomonas rubra DSM 5091]|uniref:Protein-export membrane protein SecG n=1 Tax=Malonomonas rubra DSM 5091 TaxID=1122189 RepID=A0A1M6B8V3_MALRU|nr:preprotein translocase subunit SecG [Malonomonas rubra]SHI45184.1 protein translocase subunit secG [Malonomonas rubra DSM 5091]
MSTILIALHVIVCIALIIIVLLQMGKGAEAGASFGAGASNTVFGASGGGSFMGKVTAGAAVIFMLTSLSLAYFYGSPSSQSVMPSSVAAPAAETPAPVPAAPAAEEEKK